MNKATAHWLVDTVAKTAERTNSLGETIKTLYKDYQTGRLVFAEYELAIRIARAMVQ